MHFTWSLDVDFLYIVHIKNFVLLIPYIPVTFRAEVISY